MIGMSTSNNLNRQLVSVIIPVYNCRLYLAESIQSVLAQCHRPIEIIVIDDGSTDGSPDIARQFPDVQLHLQSNRGSNAARNRGVQLSQGEFIAFLDQDDLWTPTKLSDQLALFKDNVETALVFGHVQNFFTPDIPISKRLGYGDVSRSIPGFHVGTLLLRRQTFLEIGYFDEQREYANFIEWYSAAVDRGFKHVVLPQVVMKRRIHNTNMTLQSKGEARQAFTKAIKAILDRRRREDRL